MRSPAGDQTGKPAKLDDEVSCWLLLSEMLNPKSSVASLAYPAKTMLYFGA